MPSTSPLGQFFLNKDENGNTDPAAPVDSNAFSLTKVLGTGALILTPLTTVILNALDKNNFTATHYVVLTVAVLGFLAIASAADVLARGIAGGAKSFADASQAGASTANLIKFDSPLDASYVREGAHKATDITVLGAVGGAPPQYLVKEGDDLRWMDISDVKVPR